MSFRRSIFGFAAGCLMATGTGAAALPATSSASATSSPQTAIDEEAFVQIGGIQQWVTIRGRDRANPVMLILGGTQVDGPGATLSPYTRTFEPWERDFTVVQWDQRGAGKTFVANGGAIGSDLSIERLVQDGLELTDDLRKRLGKTKIVLLGVNFGSTLAVKMILAQPDRFSAYVAAGQITRPRIERERFGYERLVRLATAARDAQSLADLELAGPDVWREPRDPARIAAFQRVFVKYRPPVPSNPVQQALSSPHWTLADLQGAQAAARQSEQAIGRAWGESFDYASLGPSLAVPVFVIQGEEATTSPAPFAKAWLDGLSAPGKVFVTIPGAGNHALETHTGVYLELLDKYVRPVAIDPPRRGRALQGPPHE